MIVAARLDLRGLACPLTWVRTRLALERLREGEALEVLLEAGEPAASVPRSAELEGHRVADSRPCGGGGQRLVLLKGPAPRPAPSWEA